jgi:hypothetical protein
MPGMPPPGGPQGPRSNILQMTPQGQAMAAMRPNPAPMKPGMPMPKMADGGSVDDMRRAIANAAKSAGMKAPVVANKALTTMQDTYESLNDKVRKGATEMQDTIESMPHKYEKGQRVFTKDSAKKNKAPYTILYKYPFGGQPMREDHPKLPPGNGIGKPIKDPATGKTKRTPYEPGYKVRSEQDGGWSEFHIPESAIVGKLASGGTVKAKGYSPLDKLMGQTYAKGGAVEVRPTVKDEAIQRKVPEMEAAAKALQAGDITRKEYDKVVQQHKPVKPYTFVPKPASDKDADRALMENKKPQWRGHEQWPAGRKVGLRLDIPAYEHHGVWVNSVHDEEGSGKDKYPTAYHSVSSVKNATFDASPEKAVRVATGEQNKAPFARIKGELHHMSEDEAVEHMKAHLNHPDWAQVGMDPRRHGFFYDRKTLKPVTHSAHVVQIGPLVLAHKPTYGKRETYAKGGTVSRETSDANKAKFLEPSKVKERLYHGTITHDVYADKDEQAFQQFTGSPTWLAEEPYTANAYAGAKGTVYPVHAQIKKPLVLGFNADDDAKRAFPTAKRLGVDVEHIQRMHRPEQAWEVVNHPSFIDAAQKAGYDSIQMHEGDYKTHGVFDPRKIKSAIGNRGTYDTSNPDINMSKGGAVKGKVTMSPNMDVMQYELLNRKAK